MAGNPGAVGNGMPEPLHYPPTEYVEDIRAVEEALIFSEIPGKRNWADLFQSIFREDYPDSRALEEAVGVCLVRMEKHYLPIKVMDLFREGQRFNSLSACK